MRAFIGMDIPEGIKEKITKRQELLRGNGVVLVKSAAQHITLHFLGEIAEEKAGLISNIIKSVKQGPFSTSLDGAGTFGGSHPHVIYLRVGKGSREITSIYMQLSEKLREAGMRTDDERSFTPHVTIARVKRAADTRRIERAVSEMSQTGFGEFSNPNIFLKKSVLTPDGPEYTMLFSRNL